MNLLSMPKGMSIFDTKSFINLGDFHVYVTKRSWVGQDYVGPEKGEEFLDELRDLTPFFNLLPQQDIAKHESAISLVIDSSVFKGEDEFSDTLLEFLEEVEDFEEETSRSEKEKVIRMKYLKRLTLYAEKIENHPYLFRWCSNNGHHPFSKLLRNKLIDVITVKANKAVRLMGNDIVDTVNKYNITYTHLQEDEYRKHVEREIDKKINSRYREEVRKYFIPLFKYAFSEASLFCYAVYAKDIFFGSIDERMRRKIDKISDAGEVRTKGPEDATMLFHISRRHYKNSFTFFSVANNDKEQCLQYETHFSGIVEDTKYQDSWEDCVPLHELECQRANNDFEQKNKLKEIVEFITPRIKKLCPPKNLSNWVYCDAPSYFTDLGIDGVKIISQELVGGPNSTELSLLASAIMVQTDNEIEEPNVKKVAIPVMDVDYWDELNAKQCSLIAYAVCLYHDVVVNENYSLTSISSDKNYFNTLYRLTFNEKLNNKQKDLSALELLFYTLSNSKHFTFTDKFQKAIYKKRIGVK